MCFLEGWRSSVGPLKVRDKGFFFTRIFSLEGNINIPVTSPLFSFETSDGNWTPMTKV
jgi:hypothetical protein